MKQYRLEKLVADAGNYSRKEAKAFIRAGHIAVNGEVICRPEAKASYQDQILMDGAQLDNQAYVYWMLNKPQGVVCATTDAHCRTVLDLVPDQFRRNGLFPAGRLDKDTEGFVLLTNDGAFAHRILAPKTHIPKTYQVRLDQPAAIGQLSAAFAEGVMLDGGDQCSPAQIQMLEEGNMPLVEVVIYEGMYHQIKRMFWKFSYRVVALKRIKIGALSLDTSLLPGEMREISAKECQLIVDSACR